MGSNDSIPYWHINVPENLRTPECPPYLKNLPPKDLKTICTPDSDFKIQSWDTVKEITHLNKLNSFERVPSEYRRYRAFTYGLKQKYGSVGTFMINERLKWEAPIKAKGNPFECPDEDIKVLYNDWPYGVDPRIVHLAVWTKFPLAEDPDSETADLTEECRGQIEDFMARTFYEHVPRDKVGLRWLGGRSWG